MDDITRRRLSDACARLDRALARNDRVSADLARMDVNRILAEAAPSKQDEGPSLPSGTPGWLRDVIRDRGIRLPALERALDVNKVVVSPSYEKGAVGVRLEIKF
jgi:hypothetical protein